VSTRVVDQHGGDDLPGAADVGGCRWRTGHAGSTGSTTAAERRTLLIGHLAGEQVVLQQRQT